MQHASDCSKHDEPAYKRSDKCTCHVGREIAVAHDAAKLAQRLVEQGPASEDMTEATVHLGRALDALARADHKAHQS